MEKNNHLTVTITGTYVGDDGNEHEVNAMYEDMGFVYLNAFKEGNDSYDMDTGAVGYACVYYWGNILEDLIRNRVGLEMAPMLLDIVQKRIREGRDDPEMQKTSYTI